MLEKLARIHDAEEAAKRGEPSPWDFGGDDFETFKADRLACFRAILEALKEPSEEMIQASGNDRNIGFAEAFTAYVNAILQEGGDG